MPDVNIPEKRHVAFEGSSTHVGGRIQSALAADAPLAPPVTSYLENLVSQAANLSSETYAVVTRLRSIVSGLNPDLFPPTADCGNIAPPAPSALLPRLDHIQAENSALLNEISDLLRYIEESVGNNA